jgi:hypothetical protein
VLLLASLVASLVLRKSRLSSSASASQGALAMPRLIRYCVLIAPWLALLAYCMKSGMVTGARLISPYYPLLLPLLLVAPGQARIVRQRWWRLLAYGVVLLSFPVLIVTPARPLWPAQTILSRLVDSHPHSRALSRALTVYRVYAIRSDPLANLSDFLPPHLKVVGFMATEDDLDISLWRPFGSRTVKHILVKDSREQIGKKGVRYLVAGSFNLTLNGVTLSAWLDRVDAEVLSTITVTMKVSEGPQDWHVVRLRD